MNKTKRIITITVEYDLTDPELKGLTLTDTNTVEKQVMDDIEQYFVDNEGFESIEVCCEDVYV